MPSTPGQGILFPERAEELLESNLEYQNYRVFGTFWRPLIDQLAVVHGAVSDQGRARLVAVPGPQGAGKTAFATELQRNFNAAKNAARGGVPLEVDVDSVWHRLAGGPQLRSDHIAEATARTEIKMYDRAPGAGSWLTEVVALPGTPDHRRIVILDNAEQAYVRQALVELDDAEFLQLGDRAIGTAAQRLVPLMRTDLRGTLLILLSYDEEFLAAFSQAIEDVHKGMSQVVPLPHPESADKEQVVRVNTNRLNKVSYWYCLDRAGPAEKRAVRESLTQARSFTDSFAAVDRAVRSQAGRTGRPPLNNILTLVALAGPHDAHVNMSGFAAQPDRTELDHGWATIRSYTTGWASPGLDSREASLLESEWSLRIAVLGDPFVGCLLACHPEKSLPDALRCCKRFLQLLCVTHGPGTHETTRTKHREALEEAIDTWPVSAVVDTGTFWNAQQARSEQYEAALRACLENYNRVGEGFLAYRPDYVVKPFRPCSILGAAGNNPQQINAAIRRNAHVLEFTAQRTPSGVSLQAYLSTKLPNYVEVTQEQ